MAELYGGFKVDADNDGRAAYFALIDEGYSGLNLQLSGVRRQRWTFFPSADDTDYYSLDQAGVYLSSTNESENLLDPGVHTFSVGGKSLKRGKSLGYDGFSCRCVED
jgi:hypothetical protein